MKKNKSHGIPNPIEDKKMTEQRKPDGRNGEARREKQSNISSAVLTKQNQILAANNCRVWFLNSYCAFSFQTIDCLLPLPDSSLCFALTSSVRMLDFPPLKWIVVCSNGLIFAFLVILMCEHYYAGNNLKVRIFPHMFTS